MTDGHRYHEFAPFRLRGELDMATAREGRVQLWAYAATTEDEVVCDCADLDFLDSFGIAMLLEVERELAALDRGLRLINVIGSPRVSLDACGLAEHFGVTGEAEVVLTRPAVVMLRYLAEFTVVGDRADGTGLGRAVAHDALDELETSGFAKPLPVPKGRTPMFVVTGAGRRKAAQLERVASES